MSDNLGIVANQAIGEKYPVNTDINSKTGNNEQTTNAMNKPSQTPEEETIYPKTIDTEKLEQGLEQLIKWLNPEEIKQTGEKVPGFMEKGAIVNNGESYYLRGMAEDGTDLYIGNVKPGSLCYDQNGTLCIIGENNKPKEFSWGKETTVVGGLNTPLEIEIAKDKETNKEIVINGKVVINPESKKEYLEQLEKVKEEEKPVDDKKWFIAGELIKPGTGGSVVEGKTINNGGVLNNANFAQKTYNSTKFSDEGIKYYSNITGKTITSVDDLSNALKSGEIQASQIPIDYVIRDGNTLILNTRSAQALEKAGISRDKWNAINRTNQQSYEDMLSGQLERNNLTSEGTSTVRPSRPK